jgi:hypothetical protein
MHNQRFGSVAFVNPVTSRRYIRDLVIQDKHQVMAHQSYGC